MRTTIVFLILAMSMLVSPSPGASAESARWHQLRQADASQTLTGISCPTRHVCYAAGNLVLRTNDRGASWRTVPVRLSGRASGIACPEIRTCYLPTSNWLILITRNGGATWTSYGLSTRPLGAIACPGPTTCYTLVVPQRAGQRDAVVVTNDGGSHWTWHSLSMERQLAAIACLSKNTCVLVGGGYMVRTSDGGRHWSIHDNGMDTGIGANGSEFTGITCPSTRECFAATSAYGREWTGGSVYHTRDAGKHWIQVYDDADSSGQSGGLLGIACRNTRTCYAVGENRYILHTADGGAHWNKEPSGAQATLNAIYCIQGATCLAVGALGTVVSNG